jgi:hypothetical protein
VGCNHQYMKDGGKNNGEVMATSPPRLSLRWGEPIAPRKQRANHIMDIPMKEG